MTLPPQDWYIECKRLQRYVTELIERCGNSRAAAEYSGVSRHTMYRILNEQCKGTQPKVAQKLLAALYRKREDDRDKKRVSERFRRTRVLQATLEERMDRLAGY